MVCVSSDCFQRCLKQLGGNILASRRGGSFEPPLFPPLLGLVVLFSWQLTCQFIEKIKTKGGTVVYTFSGAFRPLEVGFRYPVYYFKI